MRYSLKICTSAIAALVALMNVSAHAAPVLWRTEAQLTADFGEPIEIRRFSDSRIFTFRENGLPIEVQFLDGVSQRVVYSRSGTINPFSAEQIQSVLSANAPGKTWSKKDDDHWELGAPAVATASIFPFTSTGYHSDGTRSTEIDFRFELKTAAFDRGSPSTLARELLAVFFGHRRSGREKRFYGVLEFKDLEDRHRKGLRVAVVRDGRAVLEIPWSSDRFPERAHLESGKTYEITVRDEDAVDLDAPLVFVSDRVHKSYGDSVIDSECFTLVRIRQARKLVYDEARCEAHDVWMQRKTAAVGYGLFVPSKAEAFCDREYPHHADWIRGGCVVGEEKTASHYVCRECVAATAKYKREHPDEVKDIAGDD